MLKEATPFVPHTPSWLARLNGPVHRQALTVFMLVVFAHWAEHIVQAYQVFVLHWARPVAGGVLGVWFPFLVTSEVLHFAYNATLLLGLALLRPGFSGSARAFWTAALAIQAWHFLEHVLLQGQWLVGANLFGAVQPTSILQLWVPRLELHFLYNMVVFIPMVLGLYLQRPAHPAEA